MLLVSPSMWLLLLVSLGMLAAYTYLIIRKNRKLLESLHYAIGPPKLMGAVCPGFVFHIKLVSTKSYDLLVQGDHQTHPNW